MAVDVSQIASRNGAIIGPIITTRNKEEHLMFDVFMVALGLGFFLVAVGYAHACERL